MYYNVAMRMDVIWITLPENSVIFSAPLTVYIWASLCALEDNELLTTKWWESDVSC